VGGPPAWHNTRQLHLLYLCREIETLPATTHTHAHTYTHKSWWWAGPLLGTSPDNVTSCVMCVEIASLPATTHTHTHTNAHTHTRAHTEHGGGRISCLARVSNGALGGRGRGASKASRSTGCCPPSSPCACQGAADAAAHAAGAGQEAVC